MGEKCHLQWLRGGPVDHGEITLRVLILLVIVKRIEYTLSLPKRPLGSSKLSRIFFVMFVALEEIIFDKALSSSNDSCPCTVTFRMKAVQVALNSRVYIGS
jgi:hypothetical protein